MHSLDSKYNGASLVEFAALPAPGKKPYGMSSQDLLYA